MEGFSIGLAGMIIADAAATNLANVAHDLAKSEIVIEPPVEMLSAGGEGEIAAVLFQAANDIQQYSLNILA
jgi:hypothetical protein